ncbi:hypothetical protein [Carboxylicivirga sp. N1Y90]|uniref:hypothetical protein n=1 Tax=Carboxylicivirga fragile TaxID=3417571 RepID=UPI003D3567D3|nr:hypothetical protein [Marinilabiliaceae bacterium N1Y90]
MQDHITKLVLLFLFFLATSMSCEKEDVEPSNHYKIDIEYSISPNLSFTISNINDSRCPEGARCFWEGDVAMDFLIEEGNSVIDTTLDLSYHRDNPSEFGGYRFEITDVLPYPKLGTVIELDEVRVVMDLVKQ